METQHGPEPFHSSMIESLKPQGWRFFDNADMTQAECIEELTKTIESKKMFMKVAEQIVTTEKSALILWRLVHFYFKVDIPDLGYSAGQSAYFVSCHEFGIFNNLKAYRFASEKSPPQFYSCPLTFLDRATEADAINQEWREKVRQFHRNRQCTLRS